MFQKLFLLFLLSLIALVLSQRSFAQTPIVSGQTPTPVPNNKFGIHILFPTELDQAAKLVNSSGGDWGYVTIPIQANDMDLAKWQQFMSDCQRLHLIPIIRLATTGDYFNTSVWDVPTANDVTDFANFLDSLTWPTKIRYVVIYNEVNRANEWGGTIDPVAYAQLLSFAASEFHAKNPDFFVISAGLDDGADDTADTMNQYEYLNAMQRAVPGIFDQIDGLGAHAYPNPAFSLPPDQVTSKSISSFQYELRLIAQYTTKKLPVFITETGWTRDDLSDALIGKYYQEAFSTVWNDPDVVAVTPFLLFSGQGDFMQFSFLTSDGSMTEMAKMYAALPKIAGKPEVTTAALAAETVNSKNLPIKDFTPKKKMSTNPVSGFFSTLFDKWIGAHTGV